MRIEQIYVEIIVNKLKEIVMNVKRSKLVVLMLAFLITSGMCTYANGGDTIPQKILEKHQKMYQKAKNYMDSIFERHQEVFQKIKSCIGTEDIRIIQSKDFEIVQEWKGVEIDTEDRVVTMRFIKETGVYFAMSMPKSTDDDKEIKKTGIEKIMTSEKFKEEQELRSALFAKIQSCLDTENVYIIETKNADVLGMWLKAEKDDGRYVSSSPDKETGIYTAISNSLKI